MNIFEAFIPYIYQKEGSLSGDVTYICLDLCGANNTKRRLNWSFSSPDCEFILNSGPQTGEWIRINWIQVVGSTLINSLLWQLWFSTTELSTSFPKCGPLPLQFDLPLVAEGGLGLPRSPGPPPPRWHEWVTQHCCLDPRFLTLRPLPSPTQNTHSCATPKSLSKAALVNAMCP